MKVYKVRKTCGVIVSYAIHTTNRINEFGWMQFVVQIFLFIFDRISYLWTDALHKRSTLNFQNRLEINSRVKCDALDLYSLWQHRLFRCCCHRVRHTRFGHHRASSYTSLKISDSTVHFADQRWTSTRSRPFLSSSRIFTRQCVCIIKSDHVTESAYEITDCKVAKLRENYKYR